MPKRLKRTQKKRKEKRKEEKNVTSQLDSIGRGWESFGPGFLLWSCLSISHLLFLCLDKVLSSSSCLSPQKARRTETFFSTAVISLVVMTCKYLHSRTDTLGINLVIGGRPSLVLLPFTSRHWTSLLGGRLLLFVLCPYLYVILRSSGIEYSSLSKISSSYFFLASLVLIKINVLSYNFREGKSNASMHSIIYEMLNVC